MPNDPESVVPAKPPLGIPEGSVRAILALALTGTVIAMSAFGRSVPGELWQFAALALGAYFAQRPAPPPSSGG